MSIFHEMLLNRSNSFTGWKDCGNQNFQTRVMARWWENHTISRHARQLKMSSTHWPASCTGWALCLMASLWWYRKFSPSDVFHVAVLLQIRTCPVICWGPEALRGRTRNESFLVAKPNVPQKTRALGESISPTVLLAQGCLIAHSLAICMHTACPCPRNQESHVNHTFL